MWLASFSIRGLPAGPAFFYIAPYLLSIMHQYILTNAYVLHELPQRTIIGFYVGKEIGILQAFIGSENIERDLGIVIVFLGLWPNEAIYLQWMHFFIIELSKFHQINNTDIRKNVIYIIYQIYKTLRSPKEYGPIKEKYT